MSLGKQEFPTEQYSDGSSKHQDKTLTVVSCKSIAHLLLQFGSHESLRVPRQSVKGLVASLFVCYWEAIEL
jgi:hypothetical protein